MNLAFNHLSPFHSGWRGRGARALLFPMASRACRGVAPLLGDPCIRSVRHLPEPLHGRCHTGEAESRSHFS